MADAVPGAYVDVDTARATAGLRLVVTCGIPGPWVEAAKGILHVKRLDHVRVHHMAGEENAGIVAWTGCNNAPVAIFDDEPARAGWADILALAERLAPRPALIPQDEGDRALMLGMCHALCGEDGFGWNRRLLYFAAAEQALAQANVVSDRAGFDRMRGKYGSGDVARARGRSLSILVLLADRLRAQHARGFDTYFDSGLTALDIYSATFMAMLRPLPEDVCPMGPVLRAAYTADDPEILAAAAPLLAHRDIVYQRHLELPLRL